MYRKIAYKVPSPQTTFQEWARHNNANEVTSHTTVQMSAIDKIRLSRLPPPLPLSCRGADWRDLPNAEVEETDVDGGVKLHRIAYKRDGSVCTCAGRGSSLICSGRDKVGVSETLIPWCLAHTAERNGGWPDAFGRLSEEGMFAHVAGYPVPVGPNGRVFHPVQNRFCSVREFARGQGFPDSFGFFGSVTDKCHVIGAATPLLLGQAIGREILESVMQSSHH